MDLAARIAAQNQTQNAGQRQPIQAAVHASARAQQQQRTPAQAGNYGGMMGGYGGAPRGPPQQENYATYAPQEPPQVDAAQLAAQEAELDRMLAEERAAAAGMPPPAAAAPPPEAGGLASELRQQLAAAVAAEDYATAAEIKQMLNAQLAADAQTATMAAANVAAYQQSQQQYQQAQQQYQQQQQQYAQPPPSQQQQYRPQQYPQHEMPPSARPARGGGGQTRGGKENARGAIPIMPRGSPGRGGAAPPPSSHAGSGRTIGTVPHFTHSMMKPNYSQVRQRSVSPPARVRAPGARPSLAPPPTPRPPLLSQVEGVLNPGVEGIRQQMRRAGVEPRDHQRDERRRLQHMAEANRARRDEQRSQQVEDRHRLKAAREKAAAAASDRVHGGYGGYGGRARSEGTLGGAGGYDGTEIGAGGKPGVGPAVVNAGRRAGTARPAGEVPLYLQRRKAEWAQERQERAAAAAHAAECPPGLRIVGADEKAAIMAKLRDEKGKAEGALRSLPFVIKTHATQQKKDALEARLREIDGAVTAYSQEKVLVPADA